ncbi:MAG: hypothetical protein GY906_04930 [bacterium]|nr:hypothetical protein [bacterium]
MTKTTAHTGHAGNSGIQGHSCGPDGNVRTVCVGSSDNRKAVAFGVSLDSAGPIGHRDNVNLLNHAERITDEIFAGRANCEGGSHYLNRDESPTSGFCVGLHECESIKASTGRNYNAVFADVVDKLLYVHSRGWIENDVVPVCIGWWHNNGSLFIDVSFVLDNLSDAMDEGVFNNQIAIWDIAGNKEIEC